MTKLVLLFLSYEMGALQSFHGVVRKYALIELGTKFPSLPPIRLKWVQNALDKC